MADTRTRDIKRKNPKRKALKVVVVASIIIKSLVHNNSMLIIIIIIIIGNKLVTWQFISNCKKFNLLFILWNNLNKKKIFNKNILNKKSRKKIGFHLFHYWIFLSKLNWIIQSSSNHVCEIIISYSNYLNYLQKKTQQKSKFIIPLNI